MATQSIKPRSFTYGHENFFAPLMTEFGHNAFAAKTELSVKAKNEIKAGQAKASASKEKQSEPKEH